MVRKSAKSVMGAAVLASALVLSGGAPATSATDTPISLTEDRDGADAASSAQPTATAPQVNDLSDVTDRTRGGKADAVSTSSAMCDNCKGEATTIQVVTFTGGDATADNVASAWASCADCSASALSVQIVLARRAQDVVVNNRALAVNAGCAGCVTSAAAVQFVLVGGKQHEISRNARTLIAEIRTALVTRLSGAGQASSAAKAEAKMAVDDAVAKLQDVVLEDTGAITVDRHVDVQFGS